MNALVAQRRYRPRRGFTLLEVLLTLGVLVIIAGLAWPVISGSFDGQRLRMAADQVRAEIGSARAQAINSGQTQAMEFELGTGSYTVVPWQPDGISVQTSMTFGTAAAVGATPSVSAATSATPTVQGELPQNVQFLTGGVPADAASSLSAMTGAGPLAPPGMTGSTNVLLFYPDGTTSSSEVWIVNSKGRAIGIELRGLTGVAVVGDIIPQEQIDL